jgi:hypothetical protein
MGLPICERENYSGMSATPSMRTVLLQATVRKSVRVYEDAPEKVSPPYAFIRVVHHSRPIDILTARRKAAKDAWEHIRCGRNGADERI